MCWTLCVLLGVLFSSVQAQSFSDVTETWGVGDSAQSFGSAWADYDADGDLDLYVVFQRASNILYTNTGSAFTASGQAIQNGTNDNCATWGDYDGDGDLDLFTTDAAGNDLLYQNNGGGSFTDVAAAAGVQTGGDYSPGWVDYDRDGDLDLYVAVYGAANLLFANDGAGSFSDVASTAGVANTGNTVGTAWGDYNNDGWPDLYIADNSAANVLYENSGDGTFTDVTSTATVGAGTSAIAPTWGDYNNDGWLDLHVAYISSTADALYKNNGDGTFTDDASGAGVNQTAIAVSSVWADFDLDGDLDLHVNIIGAANLLYSNNGNGTFTDVAATASVADAGVGRGSSWGDVDGDGDVDLFISNYGTTNKLFQNFSTAGKNWLKLKLTGDGNNTSAIGALAVAWTGGSSQRLQVEGVSSWNSQSSPERIFGFGATTTVDSLIVRWPSGQVSASSTPAVSTTLSLTEPPLTVFSSVATAAGVNDSGNHWRGGAWADYDNDGDVDLYIFTQSGVANKLYQNNGNSTFTNVGGTTASTAENQGAAWGDYDNDGDLDLYVTVNGAANLLYRYDGSNTFVDDATGSGTGSTGTSMGAAWMDYDNDGDLDIFVASTGAANLLYENDGSGVFTDVASTALVTDASGQAHGLAWGDYDDDGDQDLYIANQSAANKLYQNNGNRTFADIGGTTADASSSFAPIWVDYDNDKDLDLFVYNGITDNRLYRNDGGGTFVEGAVAAGIGKTAIDGEGAWADYDNDGDLDLYVATSAANDLFLNRGDGTFDEVGSAAGVADLGSSLGASWGDYNGDGFLDIFVANLSGTQNHLFENQINTNKRLQVELVGEGSDSYGVGATVWATEAGSSQRRDLDGGSGFEGKAAPAAYFGFGNLGSTVDEIKVVWSSGFSNVLTGVATDQVIFLIERAVVSQTPPAGDVNASVSANITAAFSAAVTAISSSTFIAQGSYRGVLGGSYSGEGTDGISLNPTSHFLPGEEIEVRFANGTSAGLLSYRGTPVKPYIYRFTAATGTGPAEFTSAFSSPFSSATHGVDLGDVDGDGDLDLVVVNASLQNAVHLNDGTGAMVGGPNNFGTGSDNSLSVDLGDLDGDSWLDIVVANFSAQNTSHLNDGSGGFVASANFGTGTDATRPVVLGDLDGDGFMDVAVGNDGAQNVVYFNDGAGALNSWSENFGTGTDATKGLEIGDVDKDGDLDLFLGNHSEANKIALNDGWGAFYVGNTFGTGSDQSHWLAVGDVDGDGDVDVVNASLGGQSRPEINDGTGIFSAGTAFGPSASARGIKLGDMDGDNDLDVVISYDSGTTSSVYLNNASGIFSDGTKTFAGSASVTMQVAVGDIDGDDDLDIIAGNNGTNSEVHFNSNAPVVNSTSPTAAFASAPSTGNVTATFSAAVTAGDAATFVVFGSMSGTRAGAYSGNNSTTLTFNPTNDFFPGETVFSTLTTTVQNASGAGLSKGYVWDFTVEAAVGPGDFTAVFSNFGTGSDVTAGVGLGDVDGDADLDLALANQGGQSLVQLNNGSGSFSAGFRYFGGASDPKRKVEFVDLDIDGDLDIAAAHRPGQNKIHINDGSGNFATTSNFGTGSDDTYSIAFADFSGDGYIDVAVGNQAEQNVVYLNNGSGTLTGSTINFGTGSDATYVVRVADVDKDGDVDVAVGNNGAQNIVYINDGAASFGSTVNFGTGSDATHWVDFSDVDNDGDADVAVGNYGAQDAVYLNDGAGAFTAGTKNFGSGSDNTEYVTFADVEGDGDPDVAAGHWGALDVVYTNDGSGNFTTGSNIGSGSSSTWVIALGDTDLDGDLDLAVGTTGQNAVHLNALASAPTVSSTSPTASFASAPSTGNVTATFSVAVTAGDAASFVVHGSMSGKKAGAFSGNNSTALTFNPSADFFPGETVFSTLVSTIRDGSSNSLSKGHVWGFTVGAAVGPATFSSGSSADAASTYETWSASLGDLDGDGDLDLITGNRNQVNRVYLGAGNGTFAAGNDVAATVNYTIAVGMGDVDGDGDLDLIAGNGNSTGSGEVNRVYLGNGNGTFAAGSDVAATANKTSGVALGDLDADGDLDLIVGNQEAVVNRVYLGNGNGTFDAGNDISAATNNTRAVALGDVDGDGDIDLITGNHAAAEQVYLSNGDGTFATGVNVSGDTNQGRGVVLGDLDADGDLDLVVVNDTQTSRIHLGNGNGTFAAGSDVDASADATRGLALGDLDGDSDLDLVIAKANLANPFYLSNGNGTFATASNVAADANLTRVVVLGDLDGDGDLDVVAANNTTTANRVYLNSAASSAPTVSSTSPTASFASAPSTGNVTATFSTAVTGGDAASFVVHGSMTGKKAGAFSGNNSTTLTFDPSSDFFPGETVFSTLTTNIGVAAGNNLSAPRVWKFRVATSATAAPTFSSANSSLFGTGSESTQSVVLGDVDGDGDLDVGMGNNGAQSEVRLNDGTEAFSAGSKSVGGAAPSTRVLRLADVDGDGDLDALLAIDSAANEVYLNDGSGNYSSNGTYDGSNSSRGLALGDVDGDGDLDVAVGNQSQQNAFFLNNGSGSFNAGTQNFGTASDATQSLSIGDVDGDGDLDVAVGNLSEQDIVYLNDGSANFSSTANFGTGSTATIAVALADADGDGDLDVAQGINSAQNQVVINAGSGSFTGGTRNFGTGSDATKSVVWGDMDGDGDLDVSVGNSGGQNQTYLNDASGNFGGGISFGPSGDTTLEFALGDVDDDGDLDVAVGNDAEQNVVYLNGGSSNSTSNSLSGGSGPGGVGKTDGSTALAIWLKADANTSTTTDAAAVSSWSDASSSNNSFAQGTGSAQPLYKTNVLNGQPVLRFDGTDDLMATSGTLALFGSSTSPLTAITVFDTDNNEGQKFLLNHATGSNTTGNFELGYDVSSGTGSGNFGLHQGSSDATIAPSGTIASNTFNIMSLGVDSGSSPGNIAIHQNGSTLSPSDDNSGWLNSGSYPTGTDNVSLGARISADDGTTDSFHQGDIAEVIIVKDKLDDVQRILVENYLSAKYAIALGANDVYAGDDNGNGDYDLNVFGMGKTGGTVHMQGEAGGLKLFDTGFLSDDGDWVLAGHASSATVAWASSDVGSAASTERWNRIWYIDETDASSNNGTLRISFDYDEVGLGSPTGSSGDYDLLSRAGQTGDFLVLSGTSKSFNGNVVEFTLDATNLSDGYYTLGHTGASLTETQALTGLSGTNVVAPSANQKIFHVGLTGDGVTSVDSLTMTLSDLSTATGLTASDISALCIYSSTDSLFDQGDTQLAIQNTVNIGSSTTVNLSSNVIPSATERYYIAVVKIAANPTDGHAFRASVAAGGLHSSGGSAGPAIAASDANNVTIDVVATKLVFSTQPSGSVSGSALTTQPVVQAQDANGNLDTGITSLITLTTAAGGTLSNATATAVAGVATFSGLAYTATADGQSVTLTADDPAGSSPDLTAVNATAFSSDVVATQLVFTTQPVGAVYATALTTQPVVQAQNASGLLDTSMTGTVTLTPSAGSASGNTATMSVGVATFSGLALSSISSGTILTASFSVSGVTAAASNGIAVSVAPLLFTFANSILNQTYDGQLKPANPTTSPSGVSYSITYNGSATVPSAPGTYTIAVASTDANYTGSTTVQMIITGPDAPSAKLSAAPTTGPMPLTVQFTSASTGTFSGSTLATGQDGGQLGGFSAGAVTYSKPGIYTAVLTVSGPGGSSQASVTVTVLGPPTIGAIGAATAKEDEVLTLNLTGKGADSGSWSVSSIDAAQIAAHTIGGDILSFTPVKDKAGTTTVTITRTASTGLSTPQVVTLTWTPVDDPLKIVNLSSTGSGLEDMVITVGGTGHVVDIDSDRSKFVWSASGYKPELVAAAAGGNGGVVFTPLKDKFGQTGAKLTLKDPVSGLEVTQDVMLTWTPVNDPPTPPTIAKPLDKAIEIPLATVLSWSALDVDMDLLKFDVFLGIAGQPQVKVADKQTAITYSAVGLEPGTEYAWRIVARDPSEMTAETTASFKTEVDKTPPKISALSATAVNDGMRIVWQTDEPADFILNYTSVPADPTLVPEVGEITNGTAVAAKMFEVALVQLQPATWYDFAVRVRDRFNNESSATTSRFRTLAAPDLIAPVITPGSIQVNGITEGGGWVRWSTDELSIGTVAYFRVNTPAAKLAQVVDGTESGELKEQTLSRDHAVQLTGLRTASRYRLVISSVDASNNLSTPVEQHFTTAAKADLIAPQFTEGPGARPQLVTAEIELKADEAVQVEVRYDTDRTPADGRVVSGGDPAENHQITLDALIPGTIYSYQVEMVDVGTNTTISEILTFETRAVADLTAATAEGWQVVPSAESALLDFGFDELVTARVLWWPSADPNAVFFADIGNAALQHKLTLGNLLAATDYAYEIVATDEAENISAPIGGAFTTAAEPDILNPVIVSALIDAKTLEGSVLLVDVNELVTLQGALTLTGLPQDVTVAGTAVGDSKTIGSALKKNHSIALTQLVPGGDYRVDYVVTDPYTNASSGQLTFKAPLRPDIEPPQLKQLPSILSVSDVGVRLSVGYNENVQLKVKYFPTADATKAETRNFTQRQPQHEFELNGLQSGTAYRAELEASDAAKLINSQSILFTTLLEPDIVAPVFTQLPYVEDAQLTSVRLKFEADEPVVASLQLTSSESPPKVFSANAIEKTTAHGMEVSGLSPGVEYQYTLTIKDAKRNETSVQDVVSTINELVLPSIVEGPTKQKIADDRAWIKLKTNIPTRIEVEYALESSPADIQSEKPKDRSKAHVAQLTNLLPDTPYRYTVTAVDDQSQSASQPISGTFRTAKGPDIIPPQIQGPPSVTAIFDSRAKIVWQTDEPSDTKVTGSGPGGINVSAANPAQTLVHEIELTNLQPASTYTYSVSSTDLATNSTASANYSFTTLAVPDILPPVFTQNPIFRSVSHDNVVIAYTANEPSTSTVEAGTTTNYELPKITIGTAAKDHEIQINGLAAGIEYHFRVGISDALGNGPTFFPDFVVTTDAAPDIVAPVILTGPLAVTTTESKAVIEWTTDEPADRHVRFWKKDSANEGGEVEGGERVLAHQVVLNNLEPGMVYEYVVSSTDKETNGPTTSAVNEFRTKDSPQLPAITSGPFAEADESSATITWTTNVPSNSIVDLGVDTQYGAHQEQKNLVLDHKVVLENLDPAVAYHYKVTSIDLSNNTVTTDKDGGQSHSEDLTVRTLGQADGQPPKLIAEPVAKWTNTTVVISWETDEASTSRIEWENLQTGDRGFVDDNQRVFQHNSTFTGLVPRTLYAVKVISEDAAGNKMIWQPSAAAKVAAKVAYDHGLRNLASGKVAQPPGGAGTFVTDSFPDTRLPVITAGPRVREKSTESVTIEWQTDELADSFVRFGQEENTLQEVVGAGQDVQQHSITLTNLTPSTSYFFQVASTDPSGNGATKSGIAVATTAAGIDLSPPRYVREPKVVATTDRQATLEWLGDEAASATIEYRSQNSEVLVRQVRERLVGQQVSLTNLAPNTEYQALILLRDANSNQTERPFELRFTTDGEPDLVPPRFLTEPRIKVLGDRSVIIVWDTDELSDSFVDFDTSPYLGQVVGNPTYTMQHEIRLTHLEPDSTYFFRAGSTDRAKNGPIESPVSSFRTLSQPDTQPPAVPSAVLATAGPGAVLLAWDAVSASDLGGYTVYREDLRRRFVAVATGLTQSSYLDVGLTNRRTYRYRISASDAQTPANESASSTIITARPSEDALGEVPQIVGLEQGAEAGKPVVLIGNAVPLDVAAELSYTVQVSTQEDFSTMVDRGGNIIESPSGTTRWRLTRSLDPQLSYWFRTRIFDGRFEGPWSASQLLRPADALTATNSEDFDGDGTVGFRDFFIMSNGFGSTDAVLDLDQGGSVDGEDFDRFKEHFGEVMPAKRLETQRVAVAEGSRVEVEAEAISANRVVVRLKLDGVKDLSGYGFSIAADPPILRYMGRVDSALFGGRGASLELAHEGDVLAIGEHLRGRQSSLDLSEGWEIALLFEMKGAPRNVELRVEEGYLGTGRGRMLRVEQEGSARIVPQVYALYANYPNPFNPSTSIPLAIPQWADGHRREAVSLTLFNALGQVVRTWDLSGWSPGFHSLNWDGRDGQGHAVASGVYLMRLRAGEFVQVRKALLLR